MIKKINVNNLTIFVDDTDYDYVSSLPLRLLEHNKRVWVGGEHETTLGRVLLNVTDGDVEVVFKNGDTLNFTRANLVVENKIKRSNDRLKNRDVGNKTGFINMSIRTDENTRCIDVETTKRFAHKSDAEDYIKDKVQLGHRVKSYWDTKTNKWVVNIRATRRFKMDELDKALNWRDEVRFDLGLPKAKDKYKL